MLAQGKPSDQSHGENNGSGCTVADARVAVLGSQTHLHPNTVTSWLYHTQICRNRLHGIERNLLLASTSRSAFWCLPKRWNSKNPQGQLIKFQAILRWKHSGIPMFVVCRLLLAPVSRLQRPCGPASEQTAQQFCSGKGRSAQGTGPLDTETGQGT